TLLLASGSLQAQSAEAPPQAAPDPQASQASQAPQAAPAPGPQPLAFADFSWLNGNSRQSESLLDTKYFTGEFRLDANLVYDFNHPQDHTLVGSSELGRTNEVQVQQLGIGGDFHWDNVRGRIMTQFGLYSTMTPRNDASPAKGQWQTADAYRYVSEAYGGYHFDVLDGLNVDAGIFMSYIGLFSYYNFDNWAYQPSYVSSNTPWFFNGVRVQLFPNENMKVELWITNGWQSYNMYNHTPGLGASFTWSPNGSVRFISNNYFLGADTLGNQKRTRRHTDNSLEVKYYDRPGAFLDRMAFTFTGDLGDEHGGGVGGAGEPKQYFAGWMLYNRFWFDHDRHALTIGGGAITNPGRYLVLVPPINGATAASGTPYFSANPGDPFHGWDWSATYDYMPNPFVTMRAEFNRRGASVPYFAGPGGVTPPGGNQGDPGSAVAGWAPDLRKTESRLTLALLVKF
ncbi:MAG TPA: outer membrane beta-barrel protein, partial [Holophagaceae bacterium]|nr:outer membrane beta-barrel protein [Holophagaceae bacterium]